MRLKSIVVLGAGLALIPASPASAGTLSTQNSCKVSIDGIWRHMTVELSGTASPSPAAPGSGVALTRTSGRTVVPQYLLQYAANAGILQPGENKVAVRAWLAVEAPGTPQGVQVVEGQTTATTTVDDAGNATPMDVTVPFPDTTWTAPATPVGFRQGPVGQLPAVPVGPGGGNVRPVGSVFINAKIGTGGLFVNFDCQPGTGEGSNPPAPATAGAFETAQIDPGAPVVIPAPAPVAKKPALTLRTTKLKRAGKRFSLALACADAACKGTVTAKYAGGTAARSVKYSLAAGARKTYKLTLSSKARKSLGRRSLLISVKITTDGGATVTKKLRLKK
jgi:hypothetical protein